MVLRVVCEDLTPELLVNDYAMWYY